MQLLQRLEKEFGKSVIARAVNGENSVDDIAPQVVAAPRDVEAARNLVAWCGRENLAFVARGGGTKIGIGAPPARCDLLLSTEHLDEIVEHDVGNATVTAGGGIPLAKLNKIVGRNGQFVPLDDAFNTQGVLHPGATLGGAVATNDSGMSHLKYGAPRDLVVGLHAALSDGRFVQAGSKVVKNVSGYDLNKLFTGSFGTLGLITQVTLRLRPQDAASQSWQSTLPDWQSAREAAAFILDGAFEPTALRVVAGDDQLQLRARFDGGEAAVASQLERLEAKFARDESTALSASESKLILRARLPLQSAAQWAERAQSAGASRVLWDCGTGIVRAYFLEAPAEAASLVSDLRDAAQRAGGFVVVEKVPVALKTPEFVWGAPRADFPLMQRLKTAFDKANVCAPGRFVGGL